MIFDCHVHVGRHDAPSDEVLWAAAARAGVERMLVSSLGAEWVTYPSADEVAWANGAMTAFVERHRGAAWGLAYVNPKHGAAGMDALKHLLDEPGVVGVKMWTACRASDARVFPIIEEVVARGMVVLQHSWLRSVPGRFPEESTPADVAELARRYPEAKIITPHLAGNKPWGLYPLVDCANVLIDTCGSDPEAGVNERIVG